MPARSSNETKPSDDTQDHTPFPHKQRMAMSAKGIREVMLAYTRHCVRYPKRQDSSGVSIGQGVRHFAFIDGDHTHGLKLVQQPLQLVFSQLLLEQRRNGAGQGLDGAWLG